MKKTPPLLGCIADDFTGATDLANTLTRRGMSAVVLLGTPDKKRVPDADAVVVALKSRTAPAVEAVRMSVASLDWLKRAGARQFYYKYCSTFDSTPAGNIGPVADALLKALGEPFTVMCPAFPANGRTVYKGHLFVGKDLLSESSMRDHPLTPMTDALLVRVLQAQTRGKVGLIPFSIVQRGADAIWGEMRALAAQGYRYAIVDALTDEHLIAAGTACADAKLLTGGSGLALGLPANFRQQGLLSRRAGDVFPQVEGHAAVLAGSCSAATQRQVAAMKKRCPSFELDPLAMGTEQDAAAAAVAWAQPHLGVEPVLIYSTMTASRVVEVQEKLGREQAGELIERTFARIAQRLVELGVRRLVIAGGEISGAVVSALKIDALRIGQEIDPGVPWTTSLAANPIALALKSGNFGADDFFFKAFDRL
ncbi:MAG TPA: 3-oxo-tetronate kinase [Burkholderiales bacterium]|nr:3-oxo-tetronate kinase [Burkholderiales bacterium]